MYIKDFSEYSNVKFIGDLHGRFESMIYNINTLKNIKDTLIIICGDIGIGFMSDNGQYQQLKEYDRKLDKTGNHLVMFRGNHDKPELFKYENEWNQKINADCNNMSLIEDYTILRTILGNILCIGGAISVDRFQRVDNVSYWKDETLVDISDSFINELTDNGIKISIVCTHTAPNYCGPANEDKLHMGTLIDEFSYIDDTLVDDCWNERTRAAHIYNVLKENGHDIKYWIYGHFHNHFETDYEGTKFIGLDMHYYARKYINGYDYKQYDDIYEISENFA